MRRRALMLCLHHENSGLQLLLTKSIRRIPEHAFVLRQLRVEVHGVGPVVGGFGLRREGSESARA